MLWSGKNLELFLLHQCCVRNGCVVSSGETQLHQHWRAPRAAPFPSAAKRSSLHRQLFRLLDFTANRGKTRVSGEHEFKPEEGAEGSQDNSPLPGTETSTQCWHLTAVCHPFEHPSRQLDFPLKGRWYQQKSARCWDNLKKWEEVGYLLAWTCFYFQLL